jgi:hypothetical protein
MKDFHKKPCRVYFVWDTKVVDIDEKYLKDFNPEVCLRAIRILYNSHENLYESY